MITPSNDQNARARVLFPILVGLSTLGLSLDANSTTKQCPSLFKAQAEAAAVPLAPAAAFTGAITGQLLKLQPEKNLVIPTASLHSVLTMATLATGETTASRSELNHVLNHPQGVDSQTLATGYGQMLKDMSHDGDGVSSPLVRIVNAVFVNPALTISEHYAAAMRDLFGATIAPATPADVASVNSLVERVTNGKVKKVLPGLNPNMRAVLLSASYVEATWVKAFKTRATRPELFHPKGSPSTDSYNVNMMSAMADVFGTVETAQAQIVELPFRGETTSDGRSPRYSAVILLPNKGFTIDDMLTTSDQALTQALAGKANVMTSLKVPKFNFEWSGDLMGPLVELGVRAPFEKSDFTNLTDNANGLYVSQVRASAFLDFNELGFAGGGAAAVEISTRSMGPSPEKTITVDRPFVLAIRDNQLGRSLITAAVYQPNAVVAQTGSTTATPGQPVPPSTPPQGQAPAKRSGGGWR